MYRNLCLWLLCVTGMCLSEMPSSYAQLLPPNQPEQDACHALILCGNSFTTPYSYQGTGLTSDLPSTPCGGGEDNVMWLELQVNTAGTIVFTIAPISVNDDYDFAVVDMTNTDCDSLLYADVIRCNFNNNYPGSNVNGVVGLNSTSTIQTVTAGSTGNSFCQEITANPGDIYLIMINNFGNYVTGGTSQGFTIDFSGSTATFNQPPPPKFAQIVPYCDFSHEVTIQLSDNIICSSIAPDGSDFSLTPASGTITSATGVGCTGSAGYTDKVKVTFTSPLPNGNYTLHAATGTDGNTLLGLCLSPLALPDSVNFHVGNDPLTFLGIDSPACQTLTVHINSPFACASIASDGSDFTINGPSPVTITSAEGVGCTPGGFTGTVKIHLAQPIAVDGQYKLIAQIGTDGTSLEDSCGRIVLPGDYILFNVNSFNGLLQAYPDTTVCYPGSDISLYGVNNGPAPPAGFQYEWTPATGIQNPHSMNTTVTLPAMLNNYVLSTIDANGCYLRDSATIRVSPFNGQVDPEEADVCFNDPIPLHASGGVAYQWFDNPQYTGTPAALSCASCPDPSATPPVGDQTFYVLISNDVGCTDTLTSLLHVHPLPDIEVQPQDTVVKYGDGFLLRVTGGLFYNWTPAGSLSDPASPSPYAQPLKSTDYIAVGADANGCIWADTAHVVVDFRTPVYVPSAFSPNGDGLNDVFKIEHITSQKILEFSVYDRWGRLVFETKNPKVGWDGTYKGKPLNMDSYNYYIVLGYPDNYQETLKGTVTLIR